MRELSLVVNFGPLLPAWTYSRWICNQASRAMQEDGHDRVGRALDLTGRHARPDQDWVFRQQLVFELGGLEFFIRRMAASTLLARADQIDAWPRAQMGGFRFVASTPSVATWEELASGESVTMPNIGSGVLVQPGDQVIGRLVPVEGGSMFESDVPTSVWQLALLDPELLDRGDDPEYLPNNETVARAALDAASIEFEPLEQPRLASELDPWSCLGAALLEPGLSGVLPSVVAPRDHVVLRKLGDLIAEPAAAVCRLVVRELLDAA